MEVPSYVEDTERESTPASDHDSEERPDDEDLGHPEGEALWTPRAPGHLTGMFQGVHRAGWPVTLGRRTRWPQGRRTSQR